MIRRPSQRRGYGDAARRLLAMTLKEAIELRRDRMSFAIIAFVPLMLLFLFGYAIDTTPRRLPTLTLTHEHTDISRAVFAALHNTRFFNILGEAADDAQIDRALASGTAVFAIEIPAGFSRALRRGEDPAILITADATDPVATGPALTALEAVRATALDGLRGLPIGAGGRPLFQFREQRRYNPAGSTQLNVVPGLVGAILTMTTLIFTAHTVTREVERGTIEGLLVKPIHPLEILLGKILPYVFIGLFQAALIIGAGMAAFDIPIRGDVWLLAGLSTLFIATNLAIGYTFSTFADNQMQAVQMAVTFFLPNLLLSGFMFPYWGMPGWARRLAEALPLTHYLRIVRGIMLKGATFDDIRGDATGLAVLMLAAIMLAIVRFRRSLE